MPPKQDKTSSGKQVDKIYAHNKIVFYSCNRELRIDLTHDATVGERSNNSKNFLRVTKINLGDASNEREECIYIPL